MTEPDEHVETDLVDLRPHTLGAIRAERRLEDRRKVLLQQVEQPRINLGTNPPGRAD